MPDPTQQERCGGSGTVFECSACGHRSAEGHACPEMDGLTSANGIPCPGCPDCHPCEECGECRGEGRVCCGNYLDTGECCCALYGEDRLDPCPTCHGTGIEPTPQPQEAMK